MLADWLLWVIALGYLGLLFAVAFFGDRSAGYWRSGAREPVVYALSLAVYCTSWTFYGSVGRAASHGLDFVLIYVGPILVMLPGYPMVRKIARIARGQNVTSIADFIAARYGKSRVVAALASIIAAVGVLPYIALQLQAVSLSFDALVAAPDGGQGLAPPFWRDTAFYVALTMAVFAILFGVRHVQASERHQGMILAIAFESLVKLGALLAVGVFVTFGMFDGPADLLARTLADPALHVRAQNLGFRPEWLSITVLAALAFLCLPRQFHVAFVESDRLSNLRTARWLFPTYLGAINVFVPAIAVAGLLVLGAASVPDLFVLGLPISAHRPLLSLAVFIGGLSAATAMVIVEAVALSTMICNGLVMPVLLRNSVTLWSDGELGRLLLAVRRVTIFGILLLAYVYYAAIGGRFPLASIGLISFCAVAQFGPALIAGLYWRGAHRHGALAGMSGGFLVWTFAVLVPSVFDVSWFPPASALGAKGALFAIAADMDPLTQGVFWSLLLNTALLVGVSLLARPNARDRQQAETFVTSAQGDPPGFQGGGRAAAFEDLKSLVARFLGAERANLAFAGPVATLRDRDLAEYTERLLSGAIGTASARITVAAALRRRLPPIGAGRNLLSEASEAILFNRDLLRATLENIGQGIGVFDEQLRLAAWNPRFLELLELPEALARVGAPLRLMAVRSAPAVRTPGIDLKAILAEQRDPGLRQLPRSHERRRADGRVIELQTNPMPTGGFVLACTDVTERVETLEALRESERRIRVYTDNVPVLIAYVDREERYRFTNRTYEQSLGLDRRQALGLSIREALGEERYRRLKRHIDAALSGERQTFEIDFPASGIGLARGTYIPHFDDSGRVIGFFTLYQDITEQRRAEDMLRETAETLERRVAERTRELTLLNERLAEAKATADAANLGKTRFLAAASHDLLQPLHAARLFTATLTERTAGRRDAPLVGHIDQSLGAVEELLQALLEISKLDAGALRAQPRPVPIDEVLRSVTFPFEPVARRRGLRLRVVPSKAVVFSDPTLLRRILQNLVSNAVRYTRQGGVAVGCRRRGGRLAVEVWDTGPGIPAEQFSAIFEEFRRLENDDAPAGLGLGLAIVERIAKMLGHEVTVRSRPGRGSVFDVTLPLAAAVPEASPPPRPRLGANMLAGRLVLCVDDDRSILMAMQALLEGWACSVMTAADLDAALSGLRGGGRPDILLVDHHLGGAAAGLDAVDAIRSALGYAVPAVLITADRSEELQVKTRDLGLPLLNKPVKPAALRALMTQLLSGRAPAARTAAG